MSGDNKVPSVARSGAGVLGVGAAACAACCAGPIPGALAAIGVASAIGYAFAGTLAIVAGIAAAAAVIARRRRRRSACAALPSTVTVVDGPTFRSPADPVGPEVAGRRVEPSEPV